MPIRTIDLSGSPRQMGRAHGEELRSEIRDFAARRLDVCVRKARASGWPKPQVDVLGFCRASLPVHERFAPAVHQEFLGIAEGADVSADLLLVCNGLTDVVDFFSVPPLDSVGCTSWLVAPEATEDGHVLAGQTWDMHPWAEDFAILIRRRPHDAPATLSLTTAGCLSLIGINDVGIAVGNNNLTPTDARIGVVYLAMIHQVLSQTALAAAVNVITSAHRMSGHNYYLAGPEGEIVNVETTATQSHVIDPAGAIYVHSNHYLTPELAPLEASPPNRSTLYRLERMGRLLHDRAGELSPAALAEMMADQAGQGDCRICRRDPSDKAATCAAAILSPQTGQIWCARGVPSAHNMDLVSI